MKFESINMFIASYNFTICIIMSLSPNKWLLILVYYSKFACLQIFTELCIFFLIYRIGVKTSVGVETLFSDLGTYSLVYCELPEASIIMNNLQKHNIQRLHPPCCLSKSGSPCKLRISRNIDLSVFIQSAFQTQTAGKRCSLYI